MNKGRLIGGIICLALAALLGVLSVRLPADEFMFDVGGENMPWIPPVALGVVGIGLLATAWTGGQRAASRAPRQEIVVDPEKAALNQRLEMIGWGCFLIMLGGFILVPHTVVARGFWSIGVGVIMLGLNAARYALGIRMSGFTTFLGVVSLAGGILQLMGLESIEGAFLLIILGLALLGRPLFEKWKLFGKAEEA
ncbi:MAG: hypothetical protein M8467_05680 [Anaerolineae bacterium]|nr:hypothetical protein [Anaerolineae bacterium]